MTPYPEEVERAMKQFYDSLSEKGRRRYAGVEALKYGHGGRKYIAQVLGCSRRTVSKGAKEISGLPQKEVESRIRQPGGGRKSYAEKRKQSGHRSRQMYRKCSDEIRYCTAWV